MSTQEVIIKVTKGRKAETRTVTVPSDEVLVAAAIELRTAGQSAGHSAGKYGEYGNCVGVYVPKRLYTTQLIDPFTNAKGAVEPGGVMPERCSFYVEQTCIAFTLYESNPPSLHYHVHVVDMPGRDSPSSLEGAIHEVTLNVHERNRKLRDECIRLHGAQCVVCGLDFARRYGSVAAGLIHVHHLDPLGLVGAAHSVDPASDLVPVCPNCHGVMHLRNPPFAPDEVRRMLAACQP